MHCDLDLLLFYPEIHRPNTRLMGSLFMKFHDDGCKGEAIMQRKPFTVIKALTLTFGVLTRNPTGTSSAHGESLFDVSL